MTTKQTELHNQIAPETVDRIAREVTAAGGELSSMLVIAESIVAGIILFGQKTGTMNRRTRRAVLSTMASRIETRLRQIEAADRNDQPTH